jgi:hypothetical protein
MPSLLCAWTEAAPEKAAASNHAKAPCGKAFPKSERAKAKNA